MPDSHPQPNQPPFRAQEPSSRPANHPTEHPAPPIYEISVPNARLLDQRATTDYAIPSILLMENAAIGLRDHALDMLTTTRSQTILIATGPGNNAGDGFALARHLHNLNHRPTIVMTTPPEQITGDAKTNLTIITKMNIPTIDAQTYLESDPPQPGLIIDALFGTGLTRPIEGLAAKLIAQLNTWKTRGSQILAVDTPSGLNPQTGEPIGDAVIHATRTITFAALKEGYRAIEAQPYLGQVHITPLAIPIELLDSLGRQIAHPQDRDQ